jgi:hypothetical protein
MFNAVVFGSIIYYILRYSLILPIFSFSSHAGPKSSLKSPTVGSVSENVSTKSKTLSQPRKVKTGEPLSFKERQNSEESVRKKSVKEKAETTNSGLRSCLSSATTPDILKQTPEITRHSVSVQVNTLQHELEDTAQISTAKENKADALFAEMVQRNREFEACLIALQVYAHKVRIFKYVFEGRTEITFNHKLLYTVGILIISPNQPLRFQF